MDMLGLTAYYSTGYEMMMSTSGESSGANYVNTASPTYAHANPFPSDLARRTYDGIS